MSVENIKKARQLVDDFDLTVRDKLADLVDVISNIKPEDILSYVKERDGALPEGPFSEGDDPLENAKDWVGEMDGFINALFDKWKEFSEILNSNIKDSLNEGVEIFPKF